MKTDDFNFELPERLIAQHPASRRGDSRMFVLDRGAGDAGADMRHAMVRELPDFIEPGTLIVFNDSKVRKARVLGIADDTGAEVEFLLLGPAAASAPAAAPAPAASSTSTSTSTATHEGSNAWRAVCSKAKRQRPGRTYTLPGGMRARILAEADDERIVGFSPALDDAWLERHGHIPLPPYIRRPDGAEDESRYQTVYAREIGSAACPTAGLHFTEELLQALDRRGAIRATVTLHVGLGTFLPVRSATVEEHRMHEEWYTVPPETADAVRLAKREGRPVLAVGTTSLRTLESAFVSDSDNPDDPDGGSVAAGTASTRIFIYPGYRFRVVDRLFTNFHTPKSTLFMLVSAFAGEARIRKAYEEAIEREYRFFSYGDAMLIQ